MIPLDRHPLRHVHTLDDACVEAARRPHLACRACHDICLDETPRPVTCASCGAASWVYLPTGFNGWGEGVRMQTVRQLMRMLRVGALRAMRGRGGVH